MTTNPSIHGAENLGSALLLVLSAVVFVAMLVVGVVSLVRLSQEESTALAQLFQARQIARSAATLAIHPKIAPGDPILTGTSPLGGTYEVKLQSEAGRININEILKSGKNDVLQRLFEKWKVPDSESAVAIDSLLDWVDSDPHTRLNGAEQDYYQRVTPDTRFPLNREFVTVDEMALVRGMDALESLHPGWRDAFTVWSEGPLDLNDAAPSLIAAVCDLPETRLEPLLAVRTRMKALPNPELRRWKDLDEPLRVLGLPPAEIEKFRSDVTVNSSNWRAESVGRLGPRQARVIFIFGKGDGRSEILHRLEP